MKCRAHVLWCMQSATGGNITAEDVPPVHGSFQYHDCSLVGPVLLYYLRSRSRSTDSQSRSSGPTCSPPQQGLPLPKPRRPRDQARNERTTDIQSLRIRPPAADAILCPCNFLLLARVREKKPLRPGRPVIRLGSPSLFSSNDYLTRPSNRNAIIV